jgi:hypothetical protein
MECSSQFIECVDWKSGGRPIIFWQIWREPVRRGNRYAGWLRRIHRFEGNIVEAPEALVRPSHRLACIIRQRRERHRQSLWVYVLAIGVNQEKPAKLLAMALAKLFDHSVAYRSEAVAQCVCGR